MKKLPIYFVMMFYFPFVFAQVEKKLEVDENNNIIVYCNSNKNTNLFFSNPIENGTVGTKNFQFGYDNTSNGKIGILRGVSGPETNLLVTTTNGDIFSFVIRYKAEISKFNYFITSKNRIGNMNESDEDADSNSSETVTKGKKDNSSIKEVNTVTVNDFEKKQPIQEEEIEEDSPYKSNSKEVINRGVFFKRFYAEATNVKFHLSNIVYKNNELYFYLTIENSSTIDYDINTLQFQISAANKNKKTSTQKIKIEPLYVYNEPKSIASGTTADIVYVLKKFTVNKEKKVEISLSEVTGERDLIIEISNQYINNPNLN